MNRFNWKQAGLTCLVALGVASTAAITGYLTLDPYFEDRLMEQSALHIEERANRQRALFEDVRAIEVAAERSFSRRLAAIGDRDVSAEFDRLFPLYGDGTRRSVPELFEGQADERGDFVYGVGAFIPNADAMTPDRQRRLLAAYHTVRQTGEAINSRFDNIYFFTPYNDLIIFAPQREDRLEFYRMNAPADFGFQHQMTATVVDPVNNPLGITACTELTRLLYVEDGSALTTGCHTPIRAGGRHLGAFGITISMQTYLANAIVDAEPDSENMILTRDGDLIAHRELLFAEVLTPELVNGANLSARSDIISEAIRADGRANGVVVTSDDRIVAYARIETPGWYFVISRPGWLVHRQASKLAGMIFIFSFLGVFSQAIVRWLYRWLKRQGNARDKNSEPRWSAA
ncbi:PDC sensor domain-containing protein [Hyphobacterium sp.]|uniref:PDC sensor domain-containing protein n=1 Tax=Hyphobacterium sp. TaxID=2004662 RepID=UPI003BAB4378